MTTIGLISDTHGRLSTSAYAAMAEVDHIIHAGDIGDPAIICTLEQLAPVSAVLGNNDFPEYGSDIGRSAYLDVEGVSFSVSHFPPSKGRDFYEPEGGLVKGSTPHIFVHGHIHVPKLLKGKEARPALYVVCPGSVSRPRGGFPPSIAKVEVNAGAVERVEIVSLTGEVLLSASS